MSIQDLGSVGELVAAIATIVTLGYLALQLRQNTLAVRAGSSMSNMTENNAVTALIAQDPDTCELYFAGLEGTRDLADEERRRFEMLVAMWMMVLQQTRVLEADGFYDPDLAEGRRAQLAWITQQPGFRTYWDRWGPMNPPGFRGEVEALMATASRPTD